MKITTPQPSPIDPNLGFIINNRKDLAELIGIDLKDLNFWLYGLDRRSFYQQKTIPKSNGGTRVIHAVAEPLKYVQKKVLEVLQKNFTPSSYAHGFTPEKSILSNAYGHRNKRLIIKVDIKDFFPSITFSRVFGMFQGQPFQFGEQAALCLAQISCIDEDNGPLPQGGATSPYIANMLCRRMDKRLAKLASTSKCLYTRYADDITFSTNDVKNTNPEILIEKMLEIVKSEGFIPNDEKTRILHPSDRQVVTGIIVNKGLNVNRKYLMTLRAIIRNCERDGVVKQLVRAKPYKDKRTSQPGIEKVSSGKYLVKGKEVTEEKACVYFAKHLLGRLNFVSDVILYQKHLLEKKDKESQDAIRIQHELYPRINTFKDLLVRFTRLLDKPEYESVRKAARKLLLSYGTSMFLESHQVIKIEALTEFRKKEKDLISKKENAIYGCVDLSELEYFKYEESKKDPRFLITIQDKEEGIEKLKELVRYPMINYDKTISIFYSFTDSENGLGALIHSNSDFSIRRAITKIPQQYLENYYFLPKYFRVIMDVFLKELDKVNIGQDENIRIVEDSRTAPLVAALRKKIRFDDNEIVDVIKEKVERQRGKIVGGAPLIDCNNLQTDTLCTLVDNVSEAIELILTSMVKNTRGEVISVIGETNDDMREYVIKISDDSDGVIDRPAHDFCHGKLITVRKLLNGICQHSVFATFKDGNRQEFDMTNGELIPADTAVGVVHLIRLPLRK